MKIEVYSFPPKFMGPWTLSSSLQEWESPRTPVWCLSASSPGFFSFLIETRKRQEREGMRCFHLAWRPGLPEVSTEDRGSDLTPPWGTLGAHQTWPPPQDVISGLVQCVESRWRQIPDLTESRWAETLNEEAAGLSQGQRQGILRREMCLSEFSTAKLLIFLFHTVFFWREVTHWLHKRWGVVPHLHEGRASTQIIWNYFVQQILFFSLFSFATMYFHSMDSWIFICRWCALRLSFVAQMVAALVIGSSWLLPLNTFLFPVMTECSKLILCTSWPSFLAWFLFLENGVRNQDLSPRHACCRLKHCCFQVLSLLDRTRKYLCTIYIYIHTHISMYISICSICTCIKLNIALYWCFQLNSINTDPSSILPFLTCKLPLQQREVWLLPSTIHLLVGFLFVFGCAGSSLKPLGFSSRDAQA